MSTRCLFTDLFGSTAFLHALTRAFGCGRCDTGQHQPAPETLQTCDRHAAQFDSAVTLLSEHCPCARHGGAADSKIAKRMADVHASLDAGQSVSAQVRRLGFALRDTETDRAFARLRLVFPQWSGRTLRCAFSERPRRWARQQSVASWVAPSVLEQEALAALVLAAGFGHPAVDLPDEQPDDPESGLAGVFGRVGDHGFTQESGAVPVADRAGRAVAVVRERPLVSVPTAEYVLRKLRELADGVDPARARTADELRRVGLAEALRGLDAEALARMLTGVLRRLAERLPEHFDLLERARGRARSAPYHPVADPAPTAPEPPAARSPERPRPESLPEPEQAWLRWTAWTLVTQARRNPVHYATNPAAALDRFLDAHLRSRSWAIPAAWSAAVHDDDVRADLLDTLAELVTAVE
ncbi:hypothetical protein ACFPZ0_14935 [Streptomonospora nanhaiensis]|uniref:hypothetical protein n=1 Tax=Streptomonospora nanhaiensis TaxID=1323731 RepID=UPI001C38A44D|nr:hypothetical protein [Streptomonospora nanhaiensis]MBV2365654.1 hypothetical protein [Streptomonospora nanhaiensis]MBX9388108.1 hypothetical protein [Streptomonospora nanhaiensis]